MSSMSDGLNMRPRVKEPESNMLPGVAAPIPAPADLRQRLDSAIRARAAAIQPLSIQYPPIIPDTSSPIPQPPGQVLQEPAHWQYDFTSLDGLTGVSRATYPGMVNFQSSQSTPTVPVTVAQGGTGQTGYASNGLLQVTGAPGAPVVSTVQMQAGTFVPTDASGAGLTFTGATGFYYVIGNLVWALFSGTYPSTGSGVNAIIGGLPFTPVAGGIPFIIHTTPTNIVATVFGSMQANGTVGLFNNTNGSNMLNSGMSAVQFNFYVVFQHA